MFSTIQRTFPTLSHGDGVAYIDPSETHNHGFRVSGPFVGTRTPEDGFPSSRQGLTGVMSPNAAS